MLAREPVGPGLCACAPGLGQQEHPRPSLPIALVPREKLGPRNTLSQSVADGMMERRVIFNS